ncbi:MAG TPA: response regulator [Longimicrobiales bacterium]|nr:response regulator [Longimicrobiales bacterium]
MPNSKNPVRILVLDDEPIVRRGAMRLLLARGYDVLEAATAAEALRLLEETEDPVHLLICDLLLEGLPGREAAILLQARRPDMRVLYMSGSDEAEFRRQLEREEPVFLAKPFRSAQLYEAVERALA